MKTFCMVLFFATLPLIIHASPLDDKIKAFNEAVKASIKAKPDDPGTTRMSYATFSLSGAYLPEQEANLEQMARQIMETNPSPEVQKTGQALLDEIASERKARTAALQAKADAVFTHITDTLIKAQKTEDLDGILNDLQKIRPENNRYGDQEMQAVMNEVTTTYDYVARWQDYLSARNSGNIQEAQNTLRNLTSSRPATDKVIIPRSEILARIAALTNPPKTTSSTGAEPSLSPNPTDTILAGVKTVDDIPNAIAAFHALNPNDWNAGQLGPVAGAYADAKNGLPVSLESFGANTGENRSIEIERIKAMVLLYVLQKQFKVDEVAPAPNETVDDYIQRAIEAAENKPDWAALQRIIVIETTLHGSQGATGTRSFLAGLNQEMAQQYSQAVASYQTALRDSDNYVPAKFIGKRLASLQKDHPTEYDEGMKNSSGTKVGPLILPPGIIRTPTGFQRVPITDPAATNTADAPAPPSTNAPSAQVKPATAPTNAPAATPPASK